MNCRPMARNYQFSHLRSGWDSSSDLRALFIAELLVVYFVILNGVYCYIYISVREFRIDINQYLVDVGSGPITEATED